MARYVMTEQQRLMLAGVIGLFAALLVGSGEFLLHFDPQGRFEVGYDFMRGIPAARTTQGHFFAVLGAPLYLVGYWQLMKMLEPAHRMLARVAFAVMSYGIIIGAVWIGSRASISAIVNEPALTDPTALVALYAGRYETLLQVTRIAALIFSLIFAGLVLTGRSRYPRWMALFNPLALILLSFAIWALAPAVGVYLMPIALNVAFSVLFIFSIYFAKHPNTRRESI